VAGVAGRSGRPKVLPDTSHVQVKLPDADIAYAKSLAAARGGALPDAHRDLYHAGVACGPVLARTVYVLRRLLQESDVSPEVAAEAEALGEDVLDLYAERAMGTEHEPVWLEGLAAQLYAKERASRRADRWRKAELLIVADLREQGIIVSAPKTQDEALAELAEVVGSASTIEMEQSPDGVGWVPVEEGRGRT